MTAPRLKKNGGNGHDKQLARPEPSMALILQEVVSRGITSDNMATVERMMALYERAQDREAEKAFTVAFNRLMKKLPLIKATKPVQNKDGSLRYKYAPLDEIDRDLRPIAMKEGFTYSFAEGPSTEEKISKICIVQHVGGHKRSNQFTCRISAPPAANNSQADASTHSYAKRGALLDAFGIIIDRDDDARMEGKPIGKALAEDLMDRVHKLKIDEQAFLKFAGVAAKDPATIEDYENIGDSRYDYLDEILTRKAQGKPNGPKIGGEEQKRNAAGEFEWGSK